MEGNPVWSNPNYSCKLVATLPSLVKLDQQDVTQVIINQSSLLIYICSLKLALNDWTKLVNIV